MLCKVTKWAKRAALLGLLAVVTGCEKGPTEPKVEREQLTVVMSVPDVIMAASPADSMVTFSVNARGSQSGPIEDPQLLRWQMGDGYVVHGKEVTVHRRVLPVGKSEVCMIVTSPLSSSNSMRFCRETTKVPAYRIQLVHGGPERDMSRMSATLSSSLGSVTVRANPIGELFLSSGVAMGANLRLVLKDEGLGMCWFPYDIELAFNREGFTLPLFEACREVKGKTYYLDWRDLLLGRWPYYLLAGTYGVASQQDSVPAFFDRERSTVSITAQDSARIWQAEATILSGVRGKRQVYPGRAEDVDTVRAVRIIVDPENPGLIRDGLCGTGGAWVDFLGRVIGGRMTIRSTSDDICTVHEMVHAGLGTGHISCQPGYVRPLMYGEGSGCDKPELVVPGPRRFIGPEEAALSALENYQRLAITHSPPYHMREMRRAAVTILGINELAVVPFRIVGTDVRRTVMVP